MKPKSKIKVVIILVVVIAVLAAAGLGAWYFLQHRNSEPVGVYPFSYIGMTEYWGDSRESYGPVTTDRIQTVFLSETQTVTSIQVVQGDTVKKGDAIARVDKVSVMLAMAEVQETLDYLAGKIASASTEKDSTKLTAQAKSLGMKAATGLSMLVAQAKYACDLFTGQTLDDALIPTITEELQHELSR